MKSFSFWARWLEISSLLIVFFGLFIALFSGTPLFILFDQQINPVFWNQIILNKGITTFQGWIYGILGVTVVEWGIVLFYIAHYPFREKQKWARTCILVGISSWYLMDTALSLTLTFSLMF